MLHHIIVLIKRNFMVHRLGRQRACSELQKQTFFVITMTVYEIKDLKMEHSINTVSPLKTFF